MILDDPQFHVPPSPYPYAQRPEGADLPPGGKPTSARRLAANRANSRRSTGPKSAEGKAAAAGNALRHGAYSTVMLLPDESAEELGALQEGMLDELHPQGLLQREVVARIASSLWRLRRLGNVTARIAENRRQEARRVDVNHHIQIDVLHGQGKDELAGELDDKQGIFPWMTGVECLTEEIEGHGDGNRSLLSMMAAEERTERGLLAAVRLLLRLQKVGEMKGPIDSRGGSEEGGMGGRVGGSVARPSADESPHNSPLPTLPSSHLCETKPIEATEQPESDRRSRRRGVSAFRPLPSDASSPTLPLPTLSSSSDGNVNCKMEEGMETTVAPEAASLATVLASDLAPTLALPRSTGGGDELPTLPLPTLPSSHLCETKPIEATEQPESDRRSRRRGVSAFRPLPSDASSPTLPLPTLSSSLPSLDPKQADP